MSNELNTKIKYKYCKKNEVIKESENKKSLQIIEKISDEVTVIKNKNVIISECFKSVTEIKNEIKKILMNLKKTI